MTNDSKTTAPTAGPTRLFISQQQTAASDAATVRHGLWTVDGIHCRITVHGTAPLFTAADTLYTAL